MLPAYLKRSSGKTYILLSKTSDGSLRFKERGSGTSGTETVVPVSSAYTHCVIEDNAGVVRIAYRGSDNYIYEITSSDLSSWTSPVKISSMAAYAPRYGLYNNELRIAYHTESDSPTQRAIECILTNGLWGAETVAFTDSADPSYAFLEDGTKWMVHQKHSTGYIWLAIWSGSAWIDQAVVSEYPGTDPHLIVTNIGTIFLSYSANMSGTWRSRIKSYNPVTEIWSSEVIVDSTVSEWDADFLQLDDGTLCVACMRSDGIILEYTKRLYSKLGAGIFMEKKGTTGEYYIFNNGLMIQYGWSSITMGAGLGAYAVEAPGWFKTNTSAVWHFSINPASHWDFTLNGDQPNTASNARNVIITNNGVSQSAIINWFAIGPVAS
jgi:hypothetical protein